MEEEIKKQETKTERMCSYNVKFFKSKSAFVCSVRTDLLQGHIQGKSCPRLCSPPPVWHQGGWDTELWEGQEHLRCRRRTTVE